MNTHQRQTPAGSAQLRTEGAETTSVDAEPDELLELLGDEYAQRLLGELTDSARPASELVERTGISKVTVYRRLNRLEAAGLVDSQTVICPNGHHHATYRATVTAVTIGLAEDGLEVRVREEGEGP